MSTAQYLIALDVGSTFTKGALFRLESLGHQTLEATVVAPNMELATTLENIITQLSEVIQSQAKSANFDLVLIGHPPDVAVFKQAASVSRLSHEEAMTAVVKRLSSTSTVVAVDIGSRRTIVTLGKYGKTTIESFEYGVGIECWNFLRQGTSVAEFKSWLPYEASDEEIENYLANKSLYPHVIPLSSTEKAIEQTLAKLILRRVGQDLTFPWQDVNQVVLSGAVVSMTRAQQQAAAIFLDGLQPVGTQHVLVDTHCAVFACGGAFEHWSANDYRIGREILYHTLTSLGTVISFAAETNDPKQKLAKIRLDTGLSTEQLLEIRSGELASVPMPSEESGEVSIKSDAKSKPISAKDKEQSRPLVGGEVGLIFDGRSRPLQLAENEKERRVQLLTWEKQLNIHQQVGTIGEAS